MLTKFVKLSRPVQLFFAMLAYSLGAGMARYLGADIHWPVFWLALLAIISLMISTFLFTEYFCQPVTSLVLDENLWQREQDRVRILQIAFAALTFSGGIVTTLIFLRAFNLSSVILLVISILLLVAYAIPPFRLFRNGYGELALAIIISSLVPALAFVFQADKFHRILPLIAFPLTLLALAYMLIGNFPSFASDQKSGRLSLLIRLTWQWAVPIHHFLILAAFLLLSAAPFFGVAWRLIWPSLLSLPFAVLQIFWLQRIANGGRTLWNFLLPLAIATFGLPVYLLAFTFWTR